ncbi:uncharacterized protein DUF3618 [Pseudomonas duriflava]|uniref:Uncharacterized protein DUF3618 n=1 Tax=Pseudomonas duriflava TaxID=459528 RepID=A0A562Q2R1_9PSED|nr:DUF3618 domain-containing protein [Pseudomonas duriflava]TWI50953.1 uncharacterized protein DUF3618 [Pseudomonas duriflava]
MSTETQNHVNDEAQKDPATLEREIDQQRAEISGIVDALENRLSPNELIDRVMTYAKGNGGEFVNNLGATIKANPVPALLTSVGLLWMMVGQNRTQNYSNMGVAASGSSTDSLREKASSMGGSMQGKTSSLSETMHQKTGSLKAQAQGVMDKASQLRGNASGTLGSARQSMSDTTHATSDSLRTHATKAKSGFQYMLEEQPLALGVIGIAVGALLGATLPTTERENRLMGEASDRITDKAKQKAEEGYTKAAEVGSDLADQAKNRVKEEAGHASASNQESSSDSQPQRASRSM